MTDIKVEIYPDLMETQTNKRMLYNLQQEFIAGSVDDLFFTGLTGLTVLRQALYGK